MQTLTHLHFKGNCREACNYCVRALGGKIVFAMTYGESAAAAHGPAEVRDQIIHGSIWEAVARSWGAMHPGERYQVPQGFSVFDDPNAAERAFNALADAGTVGMPFAATFGARRFGMCTDRFATPWMVNCPEPEAQVRRGA